MLPGAPCLHPPPGRVARVLGLEQVRALPGVLEARLSVKPGDTIRRRRSLGQVLGAVTVAGSDRSVVERSLLEALGAIAVEYALIVQE